LEEVPRRQEEGFGCARELRREQTIFGERKKIRQLEGD
jgi:hypothetical protein